MSAVVWVLKLDVGDVIKPKLQIGNFKTTALINPQLGAPYKSFFIFFESLLVTDQSVNHNSFNFYF